MKKALSLVLLLTLCLALCACSDNSSPTANTPAKPKTMLEALTEKPWQCANKYVSEIRTIFIFHDNGTCDMTIDFDGDRLDYTTYSYTIDGDEIIVDDGAISFTYSFANGKLRLFREDLDGSIFEYTQFEDKT